MDDECKTFPPECHLHQDDECVSVAESLSRQVVRHVKEFFTADVVRELHRRLEGGIPEYQWGFKRREEGKSGTLYDVEVTIKPVIGNHDDELRVLVYCQHYDEFRSLSKDQLSDVKLKLQATLNDLVLTTAGK